MSEARRRNRKQEHGIIPTASSQRYTTTAPPACSKSEHAFRSIDFVKLSPHSLRYSPRYP